MTSTVDVLLAEVDRARAGLVDLEAEFAALADPDTVALDDEHDSEGSTVGFERARVAGLLERSRRQVADLEAAVRRMADGSYGYCASCGREIGGDRLAALPATQTCIECALAPAEDRQRHSGMRVEVFVRPNAVKVGVGGSHDGALVVRVGEPADRGRATRATLRAVADAFGLPPSSVTLFRGPTTRRKVLEIIPGGTSEQLLQDRLRQLLQVHS